MHWKKTGESKGRRRSWTRREAAAEQHLSQGEVAGLVFVEHDERGEDAEAALQSQLVAVRAVLCGEIPLEGRDDGSVEDKEEQQAGDPEEGAIEHHVEPARLRQLIGPRIDRQKSLG